MNFKYVQLNECEFNLYMNFLNESNGKERINQNYPLSALRKYEIEYILKNKNKCIKTWEDLEYDNEEYVAQDEMYKDGKTFDEYYKNYKNKRMKNIKKEVILHSQHYYVCPSCECRLYEADKKGNDSKTSEFLRHLAFAHSNRLKDQIHNKIMEPKPKSGQPFESSYLVDKEYVICEKDDNGDLKRVKINLKKDIQKIEDFDTNKYRIYSCKYDVKCSNTQRKNIINHEIGKNFKFLVGNFFENEYKMITYIKEKNEEIIHDNDLSSLLNTVITEKSKIKNVGFEVDYDKNDVLDNLIKYIKRLGNISTISNNILELDKKILDKLKELNELDELEFKNLYQQWSNIVRHRNNRASLDTNNYLMYKDLFDGEQIDKEKLLSYIESNKNTKKINKLNAINVLKGLSTENVEDNISLNKSYQEIGLSFGLFVDLNSLKCDEKNGNIYIENNSKNLLMEGIDISFNKKIDAIDTKGVHHFYEPDIYFEYKDKKFIVEIDGPCHKANYKNKNDGINELQRVDKDVIRECLLTSMGYYVIHLDDITNAIGNFRKENFKIEKIIENIKKNKETINLLRDMIRKIIEHVQNRENSSHSYLIYYSKTKGNFTYGGFKPYYNEKEGKYCLSIYTNKKSFKQHVKI